MAAVTESFPEAVAQFRTFLEREHWPSDIRWIFREDVTGHRRDLTVLLSQRPIEDEAVCERLFESGKSRGRGVRMCAHFVAGTRTCASVWVPEDEMAASYAMMTGGLRLSCSRNDLQVRLATSRIMFGAARFMNALRGEWPFRDQLPLRQKNSFRFEVRP